jgi:hypothetical protein
MVRRLPLVGRLGPDAIASAVERGAGEMAAAGAAPVEMADQALTWLGDVIERAERLFPPGAPIGCREGCPYCCHLKVIATPAEVLSLFDHLKATLAPADFDAFAGRVRAADARTRGLASDARAQLQLPCPVLVDGRCTGYTHRPLHCAGANAFDPEACREAFENPEREVLVQHYPAQRIGADAAAAGLSRALFVTRRDGRMVELIASLSLLLDDPTVRDRWERGQQAFGPAVDRELEAMLLGG